VLPWLRKQDAKKAAAMEKALALTARAYPGLKRPAPKAVDQGEFLAAASGVKLAVSNLK
jgi:hypothetical protein